MFNSESIGDPDAGGDKPSQVTSGVNFMKQFQP
jgi:hypothetical protein